MTYAVIRLGGKQFKVQEGEKIELERQENAKAEVLLFSDGDNVYLGKPILSDYEVLLKEVEQKRGKKVRVGRFKSKSRYRKIKGHRQPLSVFEVGKMGKKSDKMKKETPKTTTKSDRPKSKSSKK